MHATLYLPTDRLPTTAILRCFGAGMVLSNGKVLRAAERMADDGRVGVRGPLRSQSREALAAARTRYTRTASIGKGLISATTFLHKLSRLANYVTVTGCQRPRACQPESGFRFASGMRRTDFTSERTHWA